jgi:hypothetical protein
MTVICALPLRTVWQRNIARNEQRAPQGANAHTVPRSLEQPEERDAAVQHLTSAWFKPSPMQRQSSVTPSPCDAPQFPVATLSASAGIQRCSTQLHWRNLLQHAASHDAAANLAPPSLSFCVVRVQSRAFMRHVMSRGPCNIVPVMLSLRNRTGAEFTFGFTEGKKGQTKRDGALGFTIGFRIRIQGFREVAATFNP